MKFYKITNTDLDETPPFYTTTLAIAHEEVKGWSKPDWPGARIELVEIATDQKTLAMILSGFDAPKKILKTWRLSSRGGLVECGEGE